jgi:hypothetical protein
MKKALLVVLMICSLPALFLISIPVADPFFSKPFNPGLPHFVLLVWPDHVEIRQVESISEVSPPPSDAGYVFSVPPERVAWVEEQVRRIPPPSPDPDSAWLIRVRQVTHDRQRIQLEAWWKDQFRGMIYEATPIEIAPLKTRAGGIGNAIQIGGIDLALWCGTWIAVWIIRPLVAKR